MACAAQIFHAACRRRAHDMLDILWVPLAVGTAATNFGVCSDVRGWIDARSVIGKLFSMLSNVFPFRAPSLRFQPLVGLRPESRESSEAGEFGMRTKGWTGHAAALPTVVGSSRRCMTIRGDLFARSRADGRFIGAPDGAARPVSGS